jgi:hypothetical protein
MIIQPDFLTHWKVQALSGIIGRAEALTALLSLWGHCQNSRTCIFQFSLPMLAGICQYQGDASQLRQAMLDCRLIDLHENGQYEVHGWAEKNASLIANWTNGTKSKNPRPTHGKAMASPPETHGQSTDNPAETHGPPMGPPIEGRDRLEGEEGLDGEEGKDPAPDGGFSPVKISWSIQTGWSGFTPAIRQSLEKAFPGLDLDLVCNESDAWLRQKPGNAKKKNWFSFLTNWIRRSDPCRVTGPVSGTGEKSLEKNEGGPPSSLATDRTPSGPWRGAFQATYGRFPDAEWPSLPPAIQREIREILKNADPLLLASLQAAEKNGRAAA